MIKSIATMQNGPQSKGDMIKMGAGIVIGMAADMAVSVLLTKHMPLYLGWKKWALKLGVFVLGMKVGEDCEEYFYKVWDDTKDALKEAKTEMAEVIAEDLNDGVHSDGAGQ